SGRKLLWTGAAAGAVLGAVALTFVLLAAKKRSDGGKSAAVVAENPNPEKDLSSQEKPKGDNRLLISDSKNVPELLPPGPIGEARRSEGHGRDIRRLAVAPDGRRALPACWHKIIGRWHVRTGGHRRAF